MDIQTITKKYAYKIEPNPAGGFIARATDPTVPPIEGATREEVQRKIRETVFAGLSRAFPGLKIPLESKNAKLEFHVDRKPEGGFSVHSTEVGSPTMAPATHEKVDHVAEQLLDFVDKHFPQFSQALAAQANEVQVTTNQTVTTLPGKDLRLGIKDLLPTSQIPSDTVDVKIVNSAGKVNAVDNSIGSTITNTPITPQANSSWPFLRFLLIALAVAAVAYFFLQHR
jgi:hypothetical protein